MEFPPYRIGQRVIARALICDKGTDPHMVHAGQEGDLVYYSNADVTFTIEWPRRAEKIVTGGFQSVHRAGEWGKTIEAKTYPKPAY